MKNQSKPILISLLSTIVLSACGGGSSANTNQESTSTPSEPIQITADSWQNNQTRARSTSNTYLKTISGRFMDYLGFQGFNLGDLSNKHWQVHFDMDNNPATGYQFKDEAWSALSGIDYIVEDGVIFKSTANDTSWSWKAIGSVRTPYNADSLFRQGHISFSFDAYNKGLCDNFNVGMITLDQNWKIETFYPVANKLFKQTTTFCETNHAPLIKPNKADSSNTQNPYNVTLEIGDTYTDPGATANDKEDGNITSKIKTFTQKYGNLSQVLSGIQVDTSKIGTYQIRYEVTDSEGKSDNKFRIVNIKKPAHLNGIIIDGDNEDWRDIPALTTIPAPSYATLKVTDDQEYLYISVTGKKLYANNSQFFIDTDKNTGTGFRLNNSANNGANNGAADYLVENSSFSRFSGANQNQWAWKYNYQPIEIKTKINRGRGGRPLSKIIEMAIPKTAIHNLGNTISVSFSNLDDNWNEKTTLPKTSGTLVSYKLKFPVINVNQAPIAIDDTLTTYSARPGSKWYVEVLNNDSDPEGDSFTVTQVSTPQHGFARFYAALAGVPQNSIQYVPRNGYTGTDTFSYTITDSHGNTASANVVVTVTHDNQAPVAVEDAPTTTANTPINIDILANDYDPRHAPRNIHLVSFTQPPFGVVTEVTLPPGPSPATRRKHLRFDPQGHVGSISFTYTITDGHLTDTAVVTVAVTDPNDTTHTGWPVIANENITVRQGQSILINVLANDTDPDGDTLILDQVDSGDHGTTTKVNGKVRYTAVAGFTGTDEFWYGVHDGYGHNGAGRVSITITP